MGIIIGVWILSTVTFLLGYAIGRISLTPVKDEDEEE